MTAAETELRGAIEAALPVTLKGRVRPTTLAAARGVPSIEEIPMVLGDSMRHAARQYLKYAQGRQQAIPPRPRERDDG